MEQLHPFNPITIVIPSLLRNLRAKHAQLRWACFAHHASDSVMLNTAACCTRSERHEQAARMGCTPRFLDKLEMTV